ncbi:MAG: PDZ domain-containing protein [Bacilli bacterium]|nr:PDZ domain-containing protein [Bacilli bacterium]
MKQKIIYLVTIILSFFVGVSGTLVTLRFVPVEEKLIEKTVKTVSITESDSIKEAVNKIYNAVVVIESYRNGRQTGSGSGFVYKKNDKEGYVITNHHVIEGATSVKVVNMEGQSVDAKVLGSDEYADIAVLSMDINGVIDVAEIGDSSELNLGDTLFTVGTPVGIAYRGTVTKGILSGKDRTVSVQSSSGNGSYVMSVLQTDAAINPGNSGGPLVNINGEVIGVNSLKLVEDEIEGMGFAIPIELVMASVEKLEKGEKIERPIVGVSLLDVTNTYALYRNEITLHKDITYGAVIVNVEPNSVAEQGGLKAGDVILKVNDDKIADVAHFRYNLYKYNIGEKVKVIYNRNGEEREAMLTLNQKAE